MNSIPQVMKDRAEFEFQLFGQAKFRLNGTELNLSVRKVLALLAYLTIEGSGSRSVLAGLLWTELDEASARRNLRQRLYRLSPPELTACILVEANRVSLTGFVISDVASFESAMLEYRFADAVGLYRGLLLDGLELEEASVFHEWLDVKRELFERGFQRALAGFADQLEEAGSTREALVQHQRLIALNPLLELHQRHVMRLRAGLGERAEALAGFEDFRVLLEIELGLLPTPESFLLAAQIREQGVLKQVLPPESIPVLPAIETPMIGRKAILEQLEAGWQAQKMMVVSGEPGIGKSRLLTEFARTKNAQVMHGRAGDVTIPFATLTRVIRQLLQANPKLILPRWVRQELARLVPSLDEPPVSSGTEARIRLFDAFAEFVWLTTSQIDTYIIDDLQFFDADSFEMILHLFSSVNRPSKTRQVMAYRTGELSESMATSLEQVFKTGQTVQIQLEPLSETSVRDLVESLLGSHNPKLFSNRLHRATGGNPFFALETLKSLVESKVLQQNEQGDWGTSVDDTTTSYSELPMPETVVAAVRERVARLGVQASRLLETASLAGDAFALEDLLFVTTLTEFEALEAFERALELRLLERQAQGYRFAHDLVREALALGLGVERKRLLHRKLAENLEKRGGAAARIALHLEQAGLEENAILWRMRAAEDARRVFAHREAIKHFHKALDNGASTAQAFEIQLICLDLFGYLLDPQGESQTLATLLTLAGEIGTPQVLASVALKQSDVAYRNGRYEDCVQAGKRALGIEGIGMGLRVEIQYYTGMALEKLGQVAEAEVAYLFAHQHASEVDYKKQVGICVQLCYLGIQRTDYLAATAFLDTAFAMCEANHDRRSRAICYNASARLAFSSGNRSQAITQLERALEDARAIFDVRLQDSFLFNCIRIHVEGGELELAQAKLEEAFRLVPEPREARAETNLLTRLAEIQILRGDLAASLNSFSRAITIGAPLGQSNQQTWRVLGLARLRSQIGDLAGARKVMDSFMGTSKPKEQDDNFLVQAQLARCDFDEGRLELAHKRLLRVLELEPTDYRENRHSAMLCLGMVTLGRNEPLKALEAVVEIDSKSAIIASALVVRLKAHVMLGNDLQLEIESARALLATDRVSPLLSLELRQALASALEINHEFEQAVSVRQIASTHLLEMSATLENYPELKASFLEKYRDSTLSTRA